MVNTSRPTNARVLAAPAAASANCRHCRGTRSRCCWRHCWRCGVRPGKCQIPDQMAAVQVPIAAINTFMMMMMMCWCCRLMGRARGPPGLPCDKY